MKMKASTLVILVVSAALTILPQISEAQEAKELKKISDQENVPEFEKDISVRLQLVDVMAATSRGQYVTDLKKEDFVLTVDGRQQQIQTFDVFFPGARIGGEGGEMKVIPAAASPSRNIILFFDLAFTSYRGFRNAKSAAMEFVQQSLSPGDKVMVIGFDRSLKLYQDFTSDRDKMKEGIEAVKYTFSSPSAIRSSTFTAENQYNVRIYLKTLNEVAVSLKALRGRKTVVFLSEGFDQRIAIYYLPQYMKEALNAFNDANITIYTVNVHGLEAPGSGGVSISTLNARHDTLSILATETGGKFYRGSNNIESLLLSIDSDISHYYVLGFYVEEEFDGGFKDIKVECTKPGVRLNYRKGFFSPKAFNKLGKDERLVHLKEGLYRNSPFTEFDAGFGIYVFPRSDGTAVAGIIMEAPFGDDKAPEFEIYGLVSNKSEELIDAFHKTFSFSSRPDAQIFRHMETVSLEKGDNLIKMVIRDNTSGKRAYYYSRARMPEIGSGLIASTIAVQESDTSFIPSSRARMRSFKKQFQVPQQEPADPLAPLARSGIYPSTSLLLKRGMEVGLIIRVSGIEQTEGGPRLATSYTLRGDNGASYQLEERDLQIYPVAGAQAAIVLSQLDLSDVPAGDYVLRARVDDTSSGKIVGQQVNVSLR